MALSVCLTVHLPPPERSGGKERKRSDDHANNHGSGDNPVSLALVIKYGEPDDACSDSDERSPDGCDEKTTSQDERHAKAAAFPARKRRVGVFLEC